MIVVAGLGNPDKKYENTRHNVGFDVVDRLCDSLGVDISAKKHKGLVGLANYKGEKLLLLKPLTYMNLSGESISEALKYYKLTPKDLIVISDDINLDVGRLRIREKGSAGGHNGLKNIIACIGSDEFVRVRVGVGEKPKGWDLADYVLSRPAGEEALRMKEGLDRACEAVLTVISDGASTAMNRFN